MLLLWMICRQMNWTINQNEISSDRARYLLCVKIGILHCTWVQSSWTHIWWREKGEQTETEKDGERERVINARMSLITLNIMCVFMCVCVCAGLCVSVYRIYSVCIIYKHMCLTCMQMYFVCHLFFCKFKSVTAQLIIKYVIKVNFILLMIMSSSRCSLSLHHFLRSLLLSAPACMHACMCVSLVY